MRVCSVTQSYYLRDPRVRREAEALARSGFSVTVVCLREKGETKREIREGVYIVRLPLARKRGDVFRYLFEYFVFFVLATSFVAGMTLRRRFHIIHIHTMPDFLVFVGWFPKLLGAKVVLDVHEPMPELFVSKYGLEPKGLWISLIEFQEKASMWFADVILTIHEPMRELLRQRSSGRKPVYSLLNVPDRRVYEENSRPSADRLDERFVLIYTGTIARRYGLDIALRAVQELRAQILGIRLKIVGEGDALEELQEYVREHALVDVVSFHPPVSWDKIPEILADAHVGISPHRTDTFWDLYFSTKLVEYLWAGLPVISSRTKTLEYYLKDSTVFFVNPEDLGDFMEKVLLIFRSYKSIVQSTRNNRDNLEQFDWSQEQLKLTNLFSTLCNGSSRAKSQADRSKQTQR